MFERRNGSEWNKTCEHQLVSEKYLGVKISETFSFVVKSPNLEVYLQLLVQVIFPLTLKKEHDEIYTSIKDIYYL